MSSLGLRKVGNFEDVLARVNKDEQYKEGVIAPGIQDYAKQVINSPDFQRVKDQLEEDLATQTRTHIEHITYQNHIRGLATDFGINRSELQHITENMPGPSAGPPPQSGSSQGTFQQDNDDDGFIDVDMPDAGKKDDPMTMNTGGGGPPPSSGGAAISRTALQDMEADRQRMAAEFQQMKDDLDRRRRDAEFAAKNAELLARQSVQTPAQSIVNQIHNHNYITPQIRIPIPAVPDPNRPEIITPAQDMIRGGGKSAQQAAHAIVPTVPAAPPNMPQSTPPPRLNLNLAKAKPQNAPEMSSSSSQPPPPPQSGRVRIQKSRSPVRFGGGATGPYPALTPRQGIPVAPNPITDGHNNVPIPQRGPPIVNPIINRFVPPKRTIVDADSRTPRQRRGIAPRPEALVPFPGATPYQGSGRKIDFDGNTGFMPGVSGRTRVKDMSKIYPGTGQRLPPDEIPAEIYTPQVPPAGVRIKRKGSDIIGKKEKAYISQQAERGGGRFGGRGKPQRLDPEEFTGFRPFSGTPQKLDPELHRLAVQKMADIGYMKMQQSRKREMLDRQDDLRRAIRRGGQRGDVVPLGRRKRETNPLVENKPNRRARPTPKGLIRG